MVIETAVVQWFWLQSKRFGADQFNSLHEKLQARFDAIRVLMQPGEQFYFAGYKDNDEERQTCIYLQDLAKQIAPMGEMGLKMFQQLLAGGAALAAGGGMGGKKKAE